MAVTKNNENKGEDTMSEEKGKYVNMFSNPIIPDISVGSQEKYIG